MMNCVQGLGVEQGGVGSLYQETLRWHQKPERVPLWCWPEVGQTRAQQERPSSQPSSRAHVALLLLRAMPHWQLGQGAQGLYLRPRSQPHLRRGLYPRSTSKLRDSFWRQTVSRIIRILPHSRLTLWPWEPGLPSLMLSFLLCKTRGENHHITIYFRDCI